ncbi:hypothetical protein AVEN_3453-1 [Araneus ventricosus]|uniref:Uncharacterized protein n=1 Tax=Araneus ventricosus TaxID=182803 RepID=A0A4Y2QMX7_ARAVE|nr:hypothetical protein AVEN_156440-1 [Araneus ventricosus]GBN65481.1 hypothetical protein AVEN_3453-1 [Araneus ventricosus]
MKSCLLESVINDVVNHSKKLKACSIRNMKQQHACVESFSVFDIQYVHSRDYFVTSSLSLYFASHYDRTRNCMERQCSIMFEHQDSCDLTGTMTRALFVLILQPPRPPLRGRP